MRSSVCCGEKYVFNVLPSSFTGLTKINVLNEYLDTSILACLIVYKTFFLTSSFYKFC